MGEVWSKVEIQMPDEMSYKLVELFVSKLFDDEEHWPVEEYDKKNFRIEIEAVLATQDDVVGFAEVLTEQLYKYVEGKGDDAIKVINLASFEMHGSTEFYNCGERIDYKIEKKGSELWVSETPNYDYDEEIPQYGKPYSIKNYMQHNKVYSAEDALTSMAKINVRGKKVVLTGLDSRTENIITDYIISNGGEIKSSTVLDTNILIYDEHNGRSTKKYQRAQDLIGQGKNIEMIAASKFLQMI